MLNAILNESGVFCVDGHGILRQFECGEKNSLELPHSPNSKRLFQLHIPEGVRVIPRHFFVGYTVTKELTFPDSLVMLGKEGKGAFFRCRLNRVVLPPNAWAGKREFAACHIRQADASRVKSPEMMCRFAHALRFSHSYSLENPVESWPKAYQDIYFGRVEPKESWTELRNDSGVFWVDSDGVLMDFVRDRKKNRVKGEEKNTLIRLDIPEGVTALHEELYSGSRLSGMTILERLTLPDSMRYIGSNVFAGCELPAVILPPYLEVFGDFAFGASKISSVTIRGNMRGHLLPLHVREFRDAETREICVPAKYRSTLEVACRRWWGNRYGEKEILDERSGSAYCIFKSSEFEQSENILLTLLKEIAHEVQP